MMIDGNITSKLRFVDKVVQDNDIDEVLGAHQVGSEHIHGCKEAVVVQNCASPWTPRYRLLRVVLLLLN